MQAAIDRIRPTVIEVEINVPPKSIVFLSYEFERTYIKLSEHPPDANYGFDIGSGMITVQENQMFTENLLIRLPTPDFSMPYNVITLTCTVLALFFSSVFALISKDQVVIEAKK